MTETANRSTARKSPRGKGVTVERIYTTPGVHPYDEVTWERRDVVQTNWKSGETIFEQRGVEFPDFWSVNAGAIVTSSSPTPRPASSTATSRPRMTPRSSSTS